MEATTQVGTSTEVAKNGSARGASVPPHAALAEVWEPRIEMPPESAAEFTDQDFFPRWWPGEEPKLA